MLRQVACFSRVETIQPNVNIVFNDPGMLICRYLSLIEFARAKSDGGDFATHGIAKIFRAKAVCADWLMKNHRNRSNFLSAGFTIALQLKAMKEKFIIKLGLKMRSDRARVVIDEFLMASGTLIKFISSLFPLAHNIHHG